jgi:hypothetical protein
MLKARKASEPDDRLEAFVIWQRRKHARYELGVPIRNVDPLSWRNRGFPRVAERGSAILWFGSQIGFIRPNSALSFRNF